GGVAENARSPFASPTRERRDRDEDPREQAPDDPGPAFGSVERLPADDGHDRERERRDGGDEEARAEQEYEAPTLDAEADAGKRGHDPGGQRDGRLEDEPKLGQHPVGLEAPVREEERERSPEQAEEED